MVIAGFNAELFDKFKNGKDNVKVIQLDFNGNLMYEIGAAFNDNLKGNKSRGDLLLRMTNILESQVKRNNVLNPEELGGKFDYIISSNILSQLYPMTDLAMANLEKHYPLPYKNLKKEIVECEASYSNAKTRWVPFVIQQHIDFLFSHVNEMGMVYLADTVSMNTIPKNIQVSTYHLIRNKMPGLNDIVGKIKKLFSICREKQWDWRLESDEDDKICSLYGVKAYLLQKPIPWSFWDLISDWIGFLG